MIIAVSLSWRPSRFSRSNPRIDAGGRSEGKSIVGSSRGVPGHGHSASFSCRVNAGIKIVGKEETYSAQNAHRWARTLRVSSSVQVFGMLVSI